MFTTHVSPRFSPPDATRSELRFSRGMRPRQLTTFAPCRLRSNTRPFQSVVYRSSCPQLKKPACSILYSRVRETKAVSLSLPLNNAGLSCSSGSMRRSPRQPMPSCSRSFANWNAPEPLSALGSNFIGAEPEPRPRAIRRQRFQRVNGHPPSHPTYPRP